MSTTQEPLASSYRGPSTERLAFHGELTPEHCVAITACASPGRPFHASPHILATAPSVDEAIDIARTAYGDGEYRRVEVHVLAAGWGFPDMCSRVWSARQLSEAKPEPKPNRGENPMSTLTTTDRIALGNLTTRNEAGRHFFDTRSQLCHNDRSRRKTP